MRGECRRMHLDSCKSPLRLPAGRHSCPRQQEDAGLAQGEPYRGVRCGTVSGGGLASLLPLQQSFWLFFCGASMNWGPMQSLATNPRIWSRRWGPSPVTPWRWPAQASGPGSRLSSQLTAVLLNMLILNMYLSKVFFDFNKIGWFSAVLCHLKERRKKFRIYRCHPVYKFLTDIWV